MYDHNLLVSHGWGQYPQARGEVLGLLRALGDEKPRVQRTLARGVLGVRTSLDPRRVVEALWEAHLSGGPIPRFAVKWVPVDLWTRSGLEDVMKAVETLKARIRPGERWRMTVEKRRYNRLHKIEIIREVAELIDEKVDLVNPDRILRVEILGGYAGLSVLTPTDVYSVHGPPPPSKTSL